MQTTSSPTSSEPSSRRSRIAAAAWLALAGLQLAAAYLVARGDEPDELIYDYGLAIGTLFLDGILIGLTFAIAALYPEPLAALGLRRAPPRWFWAALGAIVVAMVAGTIVDLALGLDAGDEQGIAPETWRPERLPAVVVNTITTVTLVPFAEELFFRGLGVRALGVFGPVAAIGLSSLAFAFVHGILVAVPTLLVFAVGLAWVRARSDSIWPGAVALGLYNGVVLALAFAFL